VATDPICGMYVDERTAELKIARENRTYYFCSATCLHEFAQPERALARLRRRLAVAWSLSIVLVAITYFVRFPGAEWAAFALASVVQFYPGLLFYRSTIDAARNRSWNMDVLIAVGTTIAYGYSAVALLAPGRVPATSFFDASALIITLILSGNYLEHFTRERARGALRRLGELVPATALLEREGTEIGVPIAEVAVGDRVVVRPGARFPTDGTVVDGRSSVNEAVLTGESLPVEKGPGDRVIAGAVNGDGRLLVATTRIGADTTLAQIGALVEEAETRRVPLQQLADRIAALFVPVVLVLAVAASVGWALAGVGVTVVLLVFVSVVITACPCAFGLATPAALVVGTGRAAELGILFKGRDSLEAASRIDTVLTDKTGTLTAGRPPLTDVVPAPGASGPELLGLAAGIEGGSEHPLARAVIAAARAGSVVPAAVSGIRADPGRGIRALERGAPVAVLNATAADEERVDLGSLRDAAQRLGREGKAWSVVVRGTRAVGLLGFLDPIGPGVPAAVDALHRDGIEVVMATGDQEIAARRIAQEAGIREVHAGLSPAGKLELLGRLRASGKRVAYVGDGINDAPALAAADLGIAIGSGTDVARESGGVVLLRSEFGDVALALRLGRRTVGKVRGNLLWALGYNAILLPIAMGALVPVFGLGVFTVLPITGALAMGLSSTSVVANSLSLRWVSLG
jgi:P-type Cu+ transporter